jgi:hypothetical protein
VSEQDHRAMACNYAEPVSEAACGALAWVRWPNWGGGNDRVPLLVRSRGGRWIEKWEAMHRLTNFRLKTIPPGHPLYDRLIWQPGEDDLWRLQSACVMEYMIRTVPAQNEAPGRE